MVIAGIVIATLLASPAIFASGLLEEHKYTGICDASGAVAISDDTFAVADDELNRLLVYNVNKSGAEESVLDLNDFLKLDKEADLEGAARIDDVIYWISSHGRNRKGKKTRARMQFFATKIHHDGAATVLIPFGSPYTRLLDDLIAAPQHQGFQLDMAAKLPPKATGGLNIEAIANTPNGHLLIGFRSPTVAGQSLIIVLENPDGIIAGETAIFGRPTLIDLDDGIRALASEGERYMIIGNEQHAKHGQSSLFLWDGKSHVVEKVENLTFENFNPEAIAVFPDTQGGRILLLSDDGTVNVDGDACKDIKDRERRHFRSILYRHPELAFFD